MAEKFEEMFKSPDKNEQLNRRMETLSGAIQERAQMNDVLTEEARAMAREAVSLFESINVSSPDAVGKITLLEAALNIKSQVKRGE